MNDPITVDMLEEGHLLLTGTTGAGKTYRQRGFLEQLRFADRRVGAVDKLGNHWGVTLSADGKDPGLDFIIFGGKRGQVPMSYTDGDKIGRLFVTKNIPAIFDVSQWRSDEQQIWMAHFADAVFLHNEGALHLGLDEAQSWVPQGGGGDAFRSVQRLAEQGRGNGIFLMLACQRWSRLDATVRAMSDNMVVAMRQTSPLDRKAIADLIGMSKAQRVDIEEQLPLLKNGEVYVWEPRQARAIRYQFPPNTTFDSSRTPKHGDTPPAPIAVSNELVDELRKALAPPVPIPADYPDDTIPADPAEAFAKGGVIGEMLVERDRRIADLEGRLADALEELDELRKVDEAFNRQRVGLAQIDAQLHKILTGERVTLYWGERPAPGEAEHGLDLNQPSTIMSQPATSSGSLGQEVAEPREKSSAASDREYRPLAILAAIYPAGLSEIAWTGRAGRARKGGAWNDQRRRYQRAGLIEKRGDRWFATPAGVEAASMKIPNLPAPGADLINWWAARLGASGRLLKLLHACGGMSRAELASEAGMTASGGAFSGYVQQLKRNELIEERDRRLSVHPALTGEST